MSSQTRNDSDRPPTVASRVVFGPAVSRTLLAGVSAIALVSVVGRALAGGIPGFYTPPASASAAAAAAATAAASQTAAAAARQAQISMTNAAKAIQDARSAQNSARATFLLNMPGNLGLDPRNSGHQLPNVPDGLATGGLAPDTGWQNANAPVQSSNAGQTVVDIQQTAPSAILNWQTFNVGTNTTVNFQQQATNWSVLNRVTGNAGPSQILGHITAPGTVLVINQNGIIFGGGAQIDVHSLIASSLDVGDYTMTRQQRDQYFLNNGIAVSPTDASGNTLANFSSLLDPKSAAVDGDVTVQKGARITTTLVGTDDPGFVYLFGPNVANSGTITSPSGQVALVAGQSITLIPNVYDPQRNGVAPTSTTPDQTDYSYSVRGMGFHVSPYQALNVGGQPLPNFRAGTGSVSNDGLIETPRGTTVLNGDQVSMSGVISADTSILRNSQVFLDAVTRLDLSGSISILPFENGESLPLASSTGSNSVTSFVAPLVEMSGYQVTLQPGALVSAPGATVTASGLLTSTRATNVVSLLPPNTPQNITMMAGATIDVAGLQDVTLPASYNIVAFVPRGNEFADMPLQRSGALFGQTLYIDIRETGTRSDGSTWVGTPLADASGFVSLVGRSIDQLLTTGGSVSFNATTTADHSAASIQAGATINVAGGTVQYQAGFVRSTVLVGVDGRLYPIDKADPNLIYRGIYGDFVVDHPHWKVTETYVGAQALGNGWTYDAGYVDGYDAGSVSVQAVNSVLDGSMLFGAVIGPRQKALGQAPSQGSFSLATPQSIVLANPASATITTSPNLTNQTATPVVLAADRYSAYGLSNLSITANDFYLPSDASLTLAPGGSFKVTTAGSIDIQGSVSVRGGQINLKTESYDLSSGKFSANTKSGHSDILIGGLLDASGRWVNDARVPAVDLSGPSFVNGGSITLQTNDGNTTGGLTGNITLAAGSLLDVSSGGYIDQRGTLKLAASGVPVGNGGNISISTFQGAAFCIGDSCGSGTVAFSDLATATGLTTANIALDGSLRGYGFTTGGTLTIVTPNFQIGGQPSPAANTLNLSASFLSEGGFGSVVLASPIANTSSVFGGSLTLAANTRLDLRQQNFAPLGDYISMPTGASLGQIAAITAMPLDQRKPVNLTISSGNILLDTGSAIATDSGASIALATDAASGLLMRGSITDHGGTMLVEAPHVWLGAGANLDFSGTFIANSTFGQSAGVSQSGTLLAGGSVIFDAGSTALGPVVGAVNGFVIAEAGASIDVSGASAVIRGRVGPLGRPQDGVYTDVPSWSDGGTVAFNTGSFLWNGSFRADAGAAAGNRGTFWLGGNAVVVQATNSFVTNGNVGIDVAQTIQTNQALIADATTAQAVASLGNLTSHVLDVAAVDHLSGFDTIYLYSGTYGTTRGQGFFGAQAPYPNGVFAIADPIVRSPLSIYGNVNFNVGNRLFLEGSAIESLTSGASVSIAAPYVMLAGQEQTSAPPSAGTSSIAISGQTIDIQSAVFRGFASTSLVAQGDIRLMTPPVNDGVLANATAAQQNQTAFYGGIVASGDLSFTAQRVYPVSAVQFEILAGGTVRFSSQPGVTASDIPMSIGGSLTVISSNIVQNGNLFAPLGRISLGAQAPSDFNSLDPFATAFGNLTTNSVTLGAGSITSVSLAGQSLPFGQTEDSLNWFYNSNLAALSTLPGKAVLLIGANVGTDKNAILDESGGGDLFSFEFVQGKGGTRDVLSNLVSTGSTTRPTYTSPSVYALVPSGKQDQVAAFDIDFNSYLGDPSPLAGQQVHLNGANGLPAGWYTLYPAHYATLPGAYRIVDYGSALAKPGLAGATLPDGTQIVAGQFGQSKLGEQSSGAELFAVQSGPVWRQYTEVNSLTANSYFADLAKQNGAPTLPLPMDGGRLTVAAANTLVLDATVQASAAAGGQGSQLDIASTAIDVIEPGAQPQAGHLGVSVSQLNNSGFDSILIGGRRTDQADGTLITPTATDVRVDLSNTPFAAGEIILAAAPQIASTPIQVSPYGLFNIPAPVEGTGTVTIAAGSVIATDGATGSVGHTYLLGSATPLSAFAAALAGSVNATTGSIDNVNLNGGASLSQIGSLAVQNGIGSGAGGLLLVSNDQSVTVTRRNASPIAINGLNPIASLVLPTPGSVTVEAGARIGNGAVTAENQPQTVILSATGQNQAVNIQPGAQIGARALTLAASSIAVGDNVSGPAGFVLTPTVFAQISAANSAVNSLTLQTFAGTIDFFSFNNSQIVLNAAKTIQNITLDTASLIGHGQYVAIGSAQSLTLRNSGVGLPSTAAATGDELVIDVGTGIGDGNIILAGGDLSLAGFTTSILNADGRVFVNGSGTLSTPGNLAIVTPNLRVGGATTTGSEALFALTAAGNFVLSGNATMPEKTDQFGGKLEITAASILLNQATIQAPSGILSLHATSGDVVLGDNSRIEAPGFAQTFFDVIKYGPGGQVTLTADAGNVIALASSVIDLSQPAGGLGSGGSLDVSALQGNASLGGSMTAQGAPGIGGIFQLDTKGGLGGNSLDALADQLGTGGFNDQITVHTRTGGMTLSSGHSLTAHTIELTADDPTNAITIGTGATLDASGPTGGTISLYGHYVLIGGNILANATDPTQPGGSITVGISGIANGSYDPTYGFEQIDGTFAGAGGLLLLGSNARLDVTGGPATAADSSSITFRLPLTTAHTVNIAANAGSQIVGADSVTVEAYAVWSTTDGTTGTQHFDGIIDPAGIATSTGAATTNNANHIGFYACLSVVNCHGTLIDYVQNVSNPAIDPTGINAIFSPLGSAFHLRPSIELQNPSTAINYGDITVASNWNLAAGTIENSQIDPNSGFRVYNYNTSDINFVYRYGIEPGDLTLRAIRDVNVDASVSDGFFHFQNFADPAYVTYFTSVVNSWSAIPQAPVPSNYATPLISWIEGDTWTVGSSSTQGTFGNPTPGTGNDVAAAQSLASYDLFPAQLNVRNKLTGGVVTVAPDSWSYRITAGADFGSANPNAVGSSSAYGDAVTTTLGGHGNVVIDGHATYNRATSSIFGSPTLTALDQLAILANATATTPSALALPTMVRTGTGSIDVNAAHNVDLNDHSAPGVIYTAGRDSALLPDPAFTNSGTKAAPILTVTNVAADPGNLFVEPNVFGDFSGKLIGILTAPAFPEQAGNITITAQQDIVGWQNVTQTFSSGILPAYQFFAPWLMTQSSGASGAGAFTPGISYNKQSAWWIEFGMFDQGVLSAGGDVTVIAGRDMRDFSVSLPTTGRVSGGLSNTSTPTTHLYGDGDLTVRVGRNLTSGSIYEGSGTATIGVGGAVNSDWIGSTSDSNNKTPTMATVLAVDTGQLTFTAGLSIAIGNIVNPAEIQPNSAGLYLSTYGPTSSLSLTSVGGDVTLATSATLSNLIGSDSIFKYAQTYPARLDLTALNGSITTPQTGMVLASSPTTSLNLSAFDKIDLHGGVSPGPVAGGVAQFGPIAAGASLIDLAFNPYEPNMGTLSSSTPTLAHSNDGANDLYDRIYAVTGDISGAGDIQIPRPVLIEAGRDIIDLNLTAQNIRESDVSQIIAQRDLKYTGLAVGGGLQIAGPGFLDVEAGRNLGPFLPATGDVGSGSNPVNTQQGIVSSGNAAAFKSRRKLTSASVPIITSVQFPVGNFPQSTPILVLNTTANAVSPQVANFTIGRLNTLFVGPTDPGVAYRAGQRNFLLPDQGATIVAQFGVASGVNYDAVTSKYIAPGSATDYLGLLQSFLNGIGISTSGPADAWLKWSQLDVRLQHIFIDQVFFAELGEVTSNSQSLRGYQMINTMFPPDAPYGYTRNNISGGANGAPKDQLVQTGNLDLLHATVQSSQGGDILLFGPGGNINVGSVALEPNKNLKLNNLGILTLNGGSVDTFTDGSVLVNSSRVFTEFGGDILMWSSNGDLDAGRGARTTASLNALRVNIDNTDYQTIDAGGLVTGAGIGTLQTSSNAAKSKVQLLAPNGVIDAGDAGIRASGDLVIVAPVVLNSDNISVGGSTTGVPTATVPSLSTSSALTAGQTTTRTEPTTTGSTNAQPSVIIVEVLGYGGGDGETQNPGGTTTQPNNAPSAPNNAAPASNDDNSHSNP